MQTLRETDGKMMPHGKTAARPAGCDGHGQAPIREGRGLRRGVVPIAGDQPAPATAAEGDQSGEPELPLVVRVEPRDPGPGQRPVLPPDSGGAA